MEILVGVVVAVVLGAGWVLLLRRGGRRGGVSGAPKDVSRLLSAYRRADWTTVAEGAPAVLARPSDGSDQTWRPALELALGQSLAELDRPDEAIGHLERGLLLQAAVRRARGGGDALETGEAKLRHLLGWSYAATGRPAQARREYRRLLDQPDLDPDVRRRVEASLAALED